MRTSRIAMLVGVAAALGAAGAAEAQGVQGIGFGRKYRQQDQQKEKPYVPPSKATEKVFPLEATWTAVSLNGKGFGGERPSFSIDKQYRARGFGGCNSFAATAFPLREQSLAVGPLALTKRPCDKGLAALEQSFLVALRTAGKWDFVGSQLVIKSQAGELRLERAL